MATHGAVVTTTHNLVYNILAQLSQNLSLGVPYIKAFHLKVGLIKLRCLPTNCTPAAEVR